MLWATGDGGTCRDEVSSLWTGGRRIRLGDAPVDVRFGSSQNIVVLPAVAALIERNRAAIQEMVSCASRFTTKDAAGINVTVPSSKIGGVGKGLGLGVEVEGQFSFRPAQDLVIPINNRTGEIIPFEEVTRKGTAL